MWITPLCNEKCGVTTEIMNLTMEQLFKINEYLHIKRDYDIVYHEEYEKEQSSKQVIR